jgi:GntR family transcriptional repressor for pyruvate dehydrogenase complex
LHLAASRQPDSQPAPATVFTAVRGGRAFEAVVEQVRAAISGGSYAPGDQLPTERDLARLLHVSRAVVREALRVLELSAMVVVRHGGTPGVFVAQTPPRPLGLALRTLLKEEQFTIRELFAVNIFMEQHIAEEVALAASEEDFAALEQNIAATQHLLDHGDRPLEEELEFHRIMSRALGNRLLAELERSLADAAGRVESSRADEQDLLYRATVRQHRQILRALRSRSPRRAGRAMVAHLKTVETILLQTAGAR